MPSVYSKPLKAFSGKDDDWIEWEVDFETWTVRKQFDEFLSRRDPSTIPRVQFGYRVEREGDPNGPRGAWIRRESIRDYEYRCDQYRLKNKLL